ncbi:unnamed protein product [Lactuca virosa]|uniref:Uncharacterized protein n=1 Tax=Lactuca virosa TaxID=75947 RepID=A0AAU9M263_9ASTR|nr:unnamed protein product [Lactuca virosa]
MVLNSYGVTTWVCSFSFLLQISEQTHTLKCDSTKAKKVEMEMTDCGGRTVVVAEDFLESEFSFERF